MSITWAAVAAKLRLDERQAIIAEYLVNRGKDGCLELWASETADVAPAPIEYAAELKSHNPIEHDPATGRLVVEYLTKKKKRGAESSYLQLQYEHETSIKNELRTLLDADQDAAFRQLEIGSLLLDIDTGYSPIDDRIAILIERRRAGHAGDAPGPGDQPGPRDAGVDWSLSVVPLLRIANVTESPGIDWQHVCAELSLDHRHSTLVKYLIDGLQDRCADLWATVAADYGLSPLEYVVDLKLRRAAGGSEPTERALVDYLGATRRLGSDLTYLELQAQLERSLNHEISRLLDCDITQRLRALSIGSFLSIATGHTPIATRLSALYEEHKLKRGIDLFCGMPFEYAHIEDTGDVLPCCPSKFRLSIGNLKQDTMHDVWNSRAAEAVRESIYDKTFRFCNYYSCEYLKQGRKKHARK